MHSRPARHKTLPQKQKCIWERRIWRKKLQKEKIHAKIPATGRTAAGTGFGSFCGLLHCACACVRGYAPKTFAETFFLSDGI